MMHPPPVFSISPQRVLAAQEVAGEVDRHRGVPPVLRQVGNGLRDGRIGAVLGGVVDEDVDAPEAFDDCAYGVLDLLRVGDVATDRLGGATLRRDELRRLLQAWQSLPEHRDACTVAAKRSAIARPIPDPAPVTMATLFASRMPEQSLLYECSQRQGDDGDSAENGKPETGNRKRKIRQWKGLQ